MTLIIAEKPSVATAIAKVLGANTKKEGYFEGENTLVSWCVGHLVSLAPAESYNPNYSKWKLADLPIIPSAFQFEVLSGKEKQVKILDNLCHRNDVDIVVNACDAGREGELIFRLVYDCICCEKPIKRLWISSMEDKAIRDGFENLIEGTKMENLYQSALCRAKADWIVGINSSRLFSCLYHQSLNIGRVMSPTLALIVQRNAIISAFQSTPFYHVELDCGGLSLLSEKFQKKEQADGVQVACQGQAVTITTVEQEEKSKKPPSLYDLTLLQREANRKLGFTAQQTLDYLQSLYEQKIVTYPRTDSKFLTEDMEHGLRELCDIAQRVLGLTVEGYSPNTKAVVNNQKVTDHHAVIPTVGLQNFDVQKLPHGEREVLNLIATRLLSAMGDPHRYSETIITATCGGETFKTKGKTILDQGYLQFEKDEGDCGADHPLLSLGDQLEQTAIKIKEGKTSPPKQYTEDTILSAMERAGREEEIEQEFCGIGTPATRSSILEKLVSVNLLQRQGKGKTQSLVPTEKGHALITILPESVQSPLMTSDWEQKLKEIEDGNLTSEEFMSEICDLMTSLVRNYEVVKDSQILFPSKYPPIGTCPRCGKNVVDTNKAFSCEDRECGFVLWKDNKFFTLKRKSITEKIAKDLLTRGKTNLKGCHSEKTGKTYDCVVLLDDDGGKYVNFKMEFVKKGEKSEDRTAR